MIKLLKIMGILLIGTAIYGVLAAIRYTSFGMLLLSIMPLGFGLFVLKMHEMASAAELEEALVGSSGETVKIDVPKHVTKEPEEVKPAEVSRDMGEYFEYSEVASSFNLDGTPYISVHDVYSVAKLRKSGAGACIIERENGDLTLHKSRIDINSLAKRGLDSATVRVHLLYDSDFAVVDYDELGEWLEYCIRNKMVNQTVRKTLPNDERANYDLRMSLKFRDTVKGL